MVRAEGQKTTHASSSHWESRLLQGHLCRRPDGAHWKVGRTIERDIKARTLGCMWKEKGSKRLDDKKVFTFFLSLWHCENTPLFL